MRLRFSVLLVALAIGCRADPAPIAPRVEATAVRSNDAAAAPDVASIPDAAVADGGTAIDAAPTPSAIALPACEPRPPRSKAYDDEFGFPACREGDPICDNMLVHPLRVGVHLASFAGVAPLADVAEIQRAVARHIAGELASLERNGVPVAVLVVGRISVTLTRDGRASVDAPASVPEPLRAALIGPLDVHRPLLCDVPDGGVVHLDIQFTVRRLSWRGH